MMSRMVVQVRLRAGTAERTCWTDSSVRLHTRITLKDDSDPLQLWDVVWRGAHARPVGTLPRGWHNNI